MVRLCKNIEVGATLDARDLRALLQAVTQIAVSAGRAILEVYERPTIDVVLKADRSPLTEADRRAHDRIVSGLSELSDLPVLSEEQAPVPFSVRRAWQAYWLVDPLDGTREFLARNGEFTVNIALIERHAPVLGVVHAPAVSLLYAGAPGAVLASGTPASLAAPVVPAYRSQGGKPPEPICVRKPGPVPPRSLASRSHRDAATSAYLERLGAAAPICIGSSLKFCRLAEGGADVYPRLSPTSEWDTAAGHAVLLAAGGDVLTTDGTPLRYNTRDGLINPSFIAFGDATGDWLAPLRT